MVWTCTQSLARRVYRAAEWLTKEDIQDVREDIAEINGYLDNIETHILTDYGRRIEHVEIELKRLKDALAV